MTKNRRCFELDSRMYGRQVEYLLGDGQIRTRGRNMDHKLPVIFVGEVRREGNPKGYTEHLKIIR